MEKTIATCREEAATLQNLKQEVKKTSSLSLDMTSYTFKEYFHLYSAGNRTCKSNY